MPDRDIVRLDDLPAMGPLFARALVPGPRRTPGIPAQTALVSGHRQDVARLARYAGVCGFTLRDSVPPTWLHVLTFPLQVYLLAGPGSTLRLPGMVHVANRMRLHRPVSVTESLELRVRAADLRPHRRGALVDLIGEVRVAGEVVWDAVSTYLASGVSVPGTPEEADRDPFDPVTPLARWRLPSDLGRRYRAVSGDPNPIHTSPLAARAFGFRRPIAHGMWTHARALAALENRLPGSYAVEVAFARPVPLPGTVGFTATSQPDGWAAAVTTKDGAKPHLLLRVTA